MTVSANSPMFRLAKRLVEQTNAGKALWKTTDRSDTFMFAGADASVVLRSQDRDGSAPYALALLDSEGAEVEEFQSDAYWNPEVESYVVADTSWNNILDNLYKAARRSALNIDKLVNSLLGELDDEEPF